MIINSSTSEKNKDIFSRNLSCTKLVAFLYMNESMANIWMFPYLGRKYLENLQYVPDLQ